MANDLKALRKALEKQRDAQSQGVTEAPRSPPKSFDHARGTLVRDLRGAAKRGVEVCRMVDDAAGWVMRAPLTFAELKVVDHHLEQALEHARFLALAIKRGRKDLRALTSAKVKV